MLLAASLFLSMMIFLRYFRIMIVGIFDKRKGKLFCAGFACTVCGAVGLFLTPLVIQEEQAVPYLIPLMFSLR